MIPIMIAAGYDAPTAGVHLSGIQVVILILFAATFGVMLWGVRETKRSQKPLLKVRVNC